MKLVLINYIYLSDLIYNKLSAIFGLKRWNFDLLSGFFVFKLFQVCKMLEWSRTVFESNYLGKVFSRSNMKKKTFGILVSCLEYSFSYRNKL